ncbi:MAG: hypothetical protein K8F25_03735 [Fimbriimonadaceae bacterium]|nr:hypothetical protein [Alphaproteobacteria bacterium]
MSPDPNFVGELRLLTNQVFAPDQCDEKFLGFDAAFYLDWGRLFPMLPYVRFRRRPHYVGMPASEIGEFGRELDRRLRPYHLNLFIQFKRPEYLVRSNASEWRFWNDNYFRYRTNEKQQQLLNRIVTKGSGRAAVVYAAPAFHTSNQLYSHTSNEAVIENSNIASAELLNGHSRFSFIKAGNFGTGHSDPIEITSPAMKEIIEVPTDAEGLTFTLHMKNTANFIKQTLEDDLESRETLELARRALLRGDISEVYPGAEGSWLDATITVVAFSTAFGLRFCAIG